MMRRLAITVGLVATVQLVATGTQGVEPGFTSLFNGKDFTDWKFSGPAAAFKIQDGVIVANGVTCHAYYDGRLRNHSFRNFELKVDIKTHAGSNGGVYVLTDYEVVGGNVRSSGNFPSKGFEIQVNNRQNDRPKSGSLYHVKDILGPSPAKDDEWFTEHIIVKGDTITIRVNDKQVVQWTKTPEWNGGPEGPGRKITGPGTIALQAHDAMGPTYYKNIRIKPLD